MKINKLCIVIPALNEEDAIGDTIERCLAAQGHIKDRGGVDDVDVVVVSDGSTDRTVEIARSFDAIKVIVFVENQGYGAAIKAGWESSDANLLGFLDADGTCDPLIFAELCQRCIRDSADVVLGSRLGPQSQMPFVRRLGNRIYAILLGILCGRYVTDTASGMRVVRRSTLRHLSPLPSGLHFTPSMSARALISGMRIVEVPMTYAERVGESKLNVFRDGLRFLRTIVGGILCYRPDRLFLLAFLACLLAVGVLGLYPSEFYLKNRYLEEWMIYRFVAAFVIGACGLLLISSTALAHRMAKLSPRARQTDSFWAAAASTLFEGKGMLGFLTIYSMLALIALWPGIVEYATTRTCTLHWSRGLVGSFFLLATFQTVLTGVLIRVIEMWQYQLQNIEDSRIAAVGRKTIRPNTHVKELHHVDSVCS